MPYKHKDTVPGGLTDADRARVKEAVDALQAAGVYPCSDNVSHLVGAMTWMKVQIALRELRASGVVTVKSDRVSAIEARKRGVDDDVLKAIHELLAEDVYPSCDTISIRTGHDATACTKARRRLKAEGRLPFIPLARVGKPRAVVVAAPRKTRDESPYYRPENRDELMERVAAERTAKLRKLRGENPRRRP